MQVCFLSAAEADRVEHQRTVPDCRLHQHISKSDARQLIDAGRVTAVNARTVVNVGSPSSASKYWYDKVVQIDNRYWGVVRSGSRRSGWVRTFGSINYMPPWRRR